MFVVTGGAGFIGSNLIKGLNARGHRNILVIDNLTTGIKFKNIVNCDILDYQDKETFLLKLKDEHFLKKIKVIFHQGACSSTTEWDGRYMMANNYEYSKKVLRAALSAKIPLIYASSAAVYGLTTTFKESPEFESPLNVYGYSKLQFDRYVRPYLLKNRSQIVGLRYFNVFGPGEGHKGSMASVIYHFYNQLKAHGYMRLFDGADGYEAGEQRRDFIYVDDVVKVILWFYAHRHINGIFNVGTGQSRSFNDVANAIISYYGKGKIEYIPFPEYLRGHYQSFTEADMSLLRSHDYPATFTSLEEGIQKYLYYLS
jgi:ADP-L-glycero-D-manno-heptose 6-epimerase